jgi:hypothetical protein
MTNWFVSYWLEPLPDDYRKLTAPYSMSFKARSYRVALDKVYNPSEKKFAVKLYEIDRLPKNDKEKFRILKGYPELKAW